MTYLEWLKKYPLPSNYVVKSVPVVIRNLRRDPRDTIERTMLAILRRIAENEKLLGGHKANRRKL